MTSVPLSAIIDAFGAPVDIVVGSVDRSVAAVAPIDAASSQTDLTFCSDGSAASVKVVQNSRAGAIICLPSVATRCDVRPADEKTLIGVTNPRLAFMRAVAACFAPKRPEGIHPTATVDPEARIGARVHIGPNAWIAACTVGDDTVIHANASIYPDTRIGRNVTIHAGAVIGADGFGFERAPDGRLERFPQLGNVVIGDDAEIGANACIDRGALGSTIIGRGAKIDDLAYIAHNVVVGADALIAAHAVIAGSVRIGDRAWIAPGASVRDKTAVGDTALVGLGAAVVADIPDGATVAGVPARPLAARARSST